MARDMIKIAKAYDTVAKEYAEKFYGEHEKKPLDREVLHRFARHMMGRQPVWDFGCGPGQTTQFLADLGVHISGLDLSSGLVEQARALHPEIPFRQANMLNLDFENQSIAGVVAFYSIVHFSEDQVERAFHEVFRVLRPEGIFLLTYHIGEEPIHVGQFLGKAVDLDVMFFKTDFIYHCLEESGFESVETIEREPYPEVEYPSRRAYVFAKKLVAQERPQPAVPPDRLRSR